MFYGEVCYLSLAILRQSRTYDIVVLVIYE